MFIWNPDLTGHLNFILQLCWADWTLIIVLRESLSFLQEPWLGCVDFPSCICNWWAEGGRNLNKPNAYKRKHFGLSPFTPSPPPVFSLLGRAQNFSVQMQHLDNNLRSQWNLWIISLSLKIYCYWWALLQLAFFICWAVCFSEKPARNVAEETDVWCFLLICKGHSISFAPT